MTQILSKLGVLEGSGDATTGGGGTDASTGVLATRRRAQTKTEEKIATANVPAGGDVTVETGAVTTGRRRKRQAVLGDATGTGEEPNTYRPQLTGY